MAFHSFYSEIQIFFHVQWSMINPFCVSLLLVYHESLRIFAQAVFCLAALVFIIFQHSTQLSLPPVAIPVILSLGVTTHTSRVTFYKSYQLN